MQNSGGQSQAHAQTMDRLYSWQINIYNFTRKYYLLDRDRLLQHLSPPKTGRVIEIGCGTGRNLIQAAQLYPDVTFVGLDISSVMLEKAQKAICKANIEHRVQLIQADAANLIFSKALLKPGSYDRVFFSYTLSMIPQWNKALAEISRLVAESGILLIVDFGLMEKMHPFLKGILRLWLKIFYTTPCDGLVEGVKHLNQYGFMSDVSHPHKGYSIFIKSQKMKT